ncbi:MAG: UvrB/UvrC motif-containing protein [Phycisphaeraceae bacterium]|nr:UvrB/UvrC motif-containing protein [Phycisphaeraceae bacterium]
MKCKCDKCDQPATHHMVEISGGKKVERHLCDAHAAEEGLVKAVNTPINQLLTNLVKLHSGVSPQEDMVCEHCGMTFSQFREQRLLGCPNCYRAMEAGLGPLLEQAHGGATHHVGKVPRRGGGAEERQNLILRMRKRLEEAVGEEDYELAARLRDEIRRFEEHVS